MIPFIDTLHVIMVSLLVGNTLILRSYITRVKFYDMYNIQKKIKWFSNAIMEVNKRYRQINING